MDLASRLKSRRKKLGLSQSALADAVGVSQPTVANWEGGGHIPRRAALLRVAEALGRDTAWLLSGEPAAEHNPAHRHLAVPVRHIPVYDWPEGVAAPGEGQPARYVSFAIESADVFGLRPSPALGFEAGTVLLFDRTATALPGRFLVCREDGTSLELRHSLEDVVARLIYSVVPH